MPSKLNSWFKKLQVIQYIALCFPIFLIFTSFQPWVHLSPNAQVAQYLRYIPFNFERHYTGSEMIAQYRWFPLLFIFPILAKGHYKKLLLPLLLLYAFFIYGEIRNFESDLKASIPDFLEKYKDYFVSHRILGAAYIFATCYTLLFFYSLYSFFVRR